MTLFDQFRRIKAFVFDVDGVLTDGQVLVTEKGEQLRQFDIKDGFAIKTAVDQGYLIAIISGGKSEGVRIRLENLGVQHVYTGVEDKWMTLQNWLKDNRLNPSEVLYMGDDLPDLRAMQEIGFPVCPADAAEEVKAIATYISPKSGGHGAARDVIEKTLKLQSRWMF